MKNNDYNEGNKFLLWFNENGSICFKKLNVVTWMRMSLTSEKENKACSYLINFLKPDLLKYVSRRHITFPLYYKNNRKSPPKLTIKVTDEYIR